MLRLTQEADVICFSGGLPAPELFPIDRFREACDLVLTVNGRQALQYSPTEGYAPLRRLVAQMLQPYGLRAQESNVLITTGSQQATDLIGRLLLDSGDRIVVESPTYLGALQSFDIRQPRYTVVASDEDGMLVDELAPLFRMRPKFVYVLPNYQNPTGFTLSMERRRTLVALAQEWGVPVLEDDPYSQLRYEGELIPPVIALDAAGGNGGYCGSVVYHSTFSKVLAPGLRVGWVVAPAEVIQQLVDLKQGADLHTSTLSQMVAFEVARDGFLDEHVGRLREIYGHRRDVMLQTMEAHFPEEVTWTRPKGGLFLFVTLPDHVRAKEVLVESLRRMVAFVPGEAFFPAGGGENTFRLNFSNAKPDRIEEGIRRLGAILKAFCVHN